MDIAEDAASLTRLASQALREGRAADALALADRRHRIGPLPQAEDFLLRAAANAALRNVRAASADVQAAMEIDPENVALNRWLLNAGTAGQRSSAAATLIRCTNDPLILRKALTRVRETEALVAGHVQANIDGVSGWLTWRGTSSLQITLNDDQGAKTMVLSPDKRHPLAAAFGNAADLSLQWREGVTFVELDVGHDHPCIADRVLFRPAPQPIMRLSGARPRPNPERRVAIIIPVFGDADATQLCLDSLIADAASTTQRRIIVIDDASPEPDIRTLCETCAAKGTIDLLRNPRNLGFARSVNIALLQTGDDDVLLLNADTAVPPGFLDRLHRAAYSDEDIGTVTPLSNNGEYTSVPERFTVNPFPDRDTMHAIDDMARSANTGHIVDLPNGIGFCLYIRRDCLEALGVLSTAFGRGYCEDVEFCLRATAAGYRNVCATDVFVAHAGSRSFKAEKRALVVRNLREIERLYPGYRAMSAAFVRADPLHAARAAVDAAYSRARDAFV